ncbi:MAG: hypothetical protein EU541_07115 [Promethearchaeota archaeon]|nr:MAG: hypothetical protein EU541_07115 [Candidatus Lokiarchaeota archaeon]
MYRSKRAKWIKIILLISVFLSYLPLILFFNHLSTLPQFTYLFHGYFGSGNSLFFPWFSSINLLEIIPLKENLIQFSLGNLLDIILFCNILAYLDGILYHSFVKKIINESEDVMDYDLIYYSNSQNSPSEKNKAIDSRIIYSSPDEFTFTLQEYDFDIQNNAVPFSERQYEVRSITDLSKRSYYPYKNTLMKYFISLLPSFSYQSLYKVSDNNYPPSNQILDFLITSSYLLYICNNSIIKNYYISKALINFFKSFLLIIFTFKIFLHSHLIFYAHTITPNFSRKDCDWELYFTHMCETPFLITVVFLSVIRNRIKLFFYKSKTKILEDLNDRYNN